ncbi:Hypothetical predicted protein [Lecanosticta acicola]|uniref:Uncharacterized protein n=1 Tax=Lecanosticta acicola TaxID=111012 RepID=A0AAI9EEG1_9PEZI|nr:Hypothetical predicted protein [Lecanosticta acicola]
MGIVLVLEKQTTSTTTSSSTQQDFIQQQSMDLDFCQSRRHPYNDNTAMQFAAIAALAAFTGLAFAEVKSYTGLLAAEDSPGSHDCVESLRAHRKNPQPTTSLANH